MEEVPENEQCLYTRCVKKGVDREEYSGFRFCDDHVVEWFYVRDNPKATRRRK